jgi:hypothetical protein
MYFSSQPLRSSHQKQIFNESNEAEDNSLGTYFKSSYSDEDSDGDTCSSDSSALLDLPSPIFPSDPRFIARDARDILCPRSPIIPTAVQDGESRTKHARRGIKRAPKIHNARNEDVPIPSGAKWPVSPRHSGGSNADIRIV